MSNEKPKEPISESFFWRLRGLCIIAETCVRCDNPNGHVYMACESCRKEFRGRYPDAEGMWEDDDGTKVKLTKEGKVFFGVDTSQKEKTNE